MSVPGTYELITRKECGIVGKKREIPKKSLELLEIVKTIAKGR